MKSLAVISVVLLLIVASSEARNMSVGSTYNTTLIWQHRANYMAFPFIKRVKSVFFNDSAQRPIRGIVARDIDHSDAIATITSGGVGSTYANIRLKSARGSGLNYQIEIYV